MFFYVKAPEKEAKWWPVEAENYEERIQSSRVGFSTVLMATEGPRPGEQMSPDVQYQGPFYIDVDDDDIVKAIKKSKKVLVTLTANGIPDTAIEIYATGQRGFHFLIPMRYFTDDKPVSKLPLIYKLMVFQLQLPEEVDMSVYSANKGRMWRIANKQRADNGRYKVRITADELRDMSKSEYTTLTSAPRDFAGTTTYKGKLSAFNGLYRLSVGKAAAIETPPPIFVDEEMLEKLGADLLPPCASQMRQGENIDKSKGFNSLSVQFAKAIAAFSPENYHILADDFSTNNNAPSYNTAAKRKDHLRRAFQITSRDTTYDWSCISACSILKEEPCDGCPLINYKLDQLAKLSGEETADEMLDDEGEIPAYVPPSAATEIPAYTRPAAVTSLPSADPAPLAARTTVANTSPDPFAEPPERARSATRAPAPAVTEPEPVRAPEIDAQEPDKPVKQRAARKPPASPAPPPAAPPPDDESSEDTEDEFLVDQGLVPSENGYFFMTNGKPRYITNFTLKLLKSYVEHIPNIGQDRRVAVLAQVWIGKKMVGTTLIEEANWTRSTLLTCFHGMANAGFFGKDDDIQKMKISLMHNLDMIKGMEQVRRVHSIGIHHTRVAGKDLFTYVEPGWSVDNFGQVDKYLLSQKVNGSPELRSVPYPEQGDEMLTVVLKAMTKINSPQNIAMMFGWYMACFLKAHILSYDKQFPLLGVSGPKGAGKSKGQEVLAALHGLKYYSEHSTTNLANVTPFVVWNTLANSSTHPRIMNEYNKSKIDVRAFKGYGELFKDLFEAGARQHGTIGGNKAHGSGSGAHVVEFPLLAPAAVLSEQSVSMPALVERMVQIALNPSGLSQPGVRENFHLAKKHVTHLQRFAKAAYMRAMHTPIETVRGWIEKHTEHVPLELGDRPQISFCIVLAGLDFFETICEEYALDLSAEIRTMRSSIAAYLKADFNELREAKNQTEIDHVIIDMASMAAVSEAETNGIPRLVSEMHYYRTDKYLYLDGMVAHMLYLRYVRSNTGQTAVIESYAVFKAQIKSEPYCLGINDAPPPDWGSMTRSCIRLSLEGLQARGIEISPFLQSL